MNKKIWMSRRMRKRQSNGSEWLFYHMLECFWSNPIKVFVVLLSIYGGVVFYLYFNSIGYFPDFFASKLIFSLATTGVVGVVFSLLLLLFLLFPSMFLLHYYGDFEWSWRVFMRISVVYFIGFLFWFAVLFSDFVGDPLHFGVIIIAVALIFGLLYLVGCHSSRSSKKADIFINILSLSFSLTWLVVPVLFSFIYSLVHYKINVLYAFIFYCLLLFVILVLYNYIIYKIGMSGGVPFLYLILMIFPFVFHSFPKSIMVSEGLVIEHGKIVVDKVGCSHLSRRMIRIHDNVCVLDDVKILWHLGNEIVLEKASESTKIKRVVINRSHIFNMSWEVNEKERK